MLLFLNLIYPFQKEDPQPLPTQELPATGEAAGEDKRKPHYISSIIFTNNFQKNPKRHQKTVKAADSKSYRRREAASYSLADAAV